VKEIQEVRSGNFLEEGADEIETLPYFTLNIVVVNYEEYYGQ